MVETFTAPFVHFIPSNVLMVLANYIIYAGQLVNKAPLAKKDASGLKKARAERTPKFL